MSDDKTFLARWSRRKREAAPDTREQPKPENAGGGAASRASAASLLPGETHPLFDPASLPPIESIVAGSDISAFLAAGAPADIARAALRRVWSSDDPATSSACPRIRGISMYLAQCRALDRSTGRKLGEPDPTAVAAHPPTTSSQTDKHARNPVGPRIHANPGIGRAGSRARSTAATDVTQRREAVPASQHESSSGDQRQITARLGQGSALPR
jgi:hypothetical protein